MRAVFCPNYGPPRVLEHRNIEQPQPADTEILIRSSAASVTAGDCRVRALKMPTGFRLIGRLALGITKPRQPILGSELSGTVVAIGKRVTKFNIGDEVILFTGTKLGCYAEFKSVSQDGAVIAKPANISFHEAAALASGGTTALAFLKRAGIREGSRTLVIGASGGVGSAAVMLAKHFGAHVTAVCSSRNLDFVTSLGADRVLDYTKEDFTESGEVYDVILDATGTVSYSRAKESMTADGRLLLISATLPDLLKSALATIGSRRKVIAGPAKWTVDDLSYLSLVVESGHYRVPVDRTFPLGQIAEAHAYVDTGRKKGNVVISMGADAATPTHV